MKLDLKLKRAVREDAELLTELRIKQLIDEGPARIYDTENEMIDFFKRKLKDGSLVQFIAEEKGEAVATAAVLYQEFPPSIS